MSEGVEQVIQTLNKLQSMEEVTDLDTLDDCIEKLKEFPNPEASIDELLNIFEKFPDKDGYGVFWSVLHFLETMPGRYESKLIESVKRQPMEFSLQMVNRLINKGITEVNGECLIELLRDIADNESFSESARKQAQRYYDFQKQGGIQHLA